MLTSLFRKALAVLTSASSAAAIQQNEVEAENTNSTRLFAFISRTRTTGRIEVQELHDPRLRELLQDLARAATSGKTIGTVDHDRIQNVVRDLTQFVAASAPDVRALYHFLCQQWAEYEAVDPDGTLLEETATLADAALWKELMRLARVSGRAAWIETTATARSNRDFETMTDGDWEQLITTLVQGEAWPRMWSLVNVVPPFRARGLLFQLRNAGWKPESPEVRTAFEGLLGFARNLDEKIPFWAGPLIRRMVPVYTCQCVALSGNGEWMAAGCDREIRVLPVHRSAADHARTFAPDSTPTCLAFAPDQSVLYAGDDHGSITRIAFELGSTHRTMDILRASRTSAISAVAVDREHLLAGAASGEVFIGTQEPGTFLAHPVQVLGPTGTGPIRVLVCDKMRHHVAVDDLGQPWIFNERGGEFTSSGPPGTLPAGLRAFARSGGRGTLILSEESAPGPVEIRELGDSGDQLGSFLLPEDLTQATCVALGSDGSTAVFGFRDRRIEVVESRFHRLLQTPAALMNEDVLPDLPPSHQPWLEFIRCLRDWSRLHDIEIEEIGPEALP